MTGVSMHTQQYQDDGAAEFSIIIAMVSSVDGDRILQTLDAIKSQQGEHCYEVIVADRRGDDISARIDADFPEIQRFPCPADMSLPHMRTLALERACGTYIIVTEDHCVPADNWLNSISQAFDNAPPATVAVGGCIENGVNDTALDKATFLCDYGFFMEPVEEGETTVLPGMNVAYHHSVFEHIDQDILTNSFWETSLHPVLIHAGYRFYSSNNIRVSHCKKFGFGLFARQRYLYSRYYAGRRFSHSQSMHRILACLASVLLPPLLLYRGFRNTTSKKRSQREFFSALPFLTVFYMIWAYGEITGYLFGQGEALSKIE